MKRAALVALAVWGLSACSDEKLPRSQLLDPEACRSCHPDHYREWSGSMHAYAALDPVFLAMNARGQRETNGELGDFCVKCHAPMALIEGATTDGLNLAEVSPALLGITCYFCHQVVEVEGTHNNPLRLANDTIMRGGLRDPVNSAAHDSEYSALHDRGDIRSSDLCGSCHDIVTPANVHLERTFSEWKESLFAHDTPAELQTCGRCHMRGREGLAADAPGVFLRRVASHAFPGVDVALTDFPEAAVQRELVQRELDTTLLAQLCVARSAGGVDVTVDLENLAAGHSWPSGAAHDRRAWVELVASRGGAVMFESGVLPDDQALTELSDPNLWRMGDRVFDAEDRPVHMFWDVARYESSLLPAATAIAPWDPDYRDPHVKRTYLIPGIPDRISMRVRIRPMGLDVLADLEDSGDLDPLYRSRIPTFDLSATRLEWTVDQGEGCFPDL